MRRNENEGWVPLLVRYGTRFFRFVMAQIFDEDEQVYDKLLAIGITTTRVPPPHAMFKAT